MGVDIQSKEDLEDYLGSTYRPTAYKVMAKELELLKTARTLGLETQEAVLSSLMAPAHARCVQVCMRSVRVYVRCVCVRVCACARACVRACARVQAHAPGLVHGVVRPNHVMLFVQSWIILTCLAMRCAATMQVVAPTRVNDMCFFCFFFCPGGLQGADRSPEASSDTKEEDPPHHPHTKATAATTNPD